MQYKKIYIEITNVCNLSCSFCAKTNREPKFMTKERFIEVLEKIKEYTNYIYLHVMGEPLLHPEINDFIEIAHQMGFKVNITTNATLLHRIKANKHIRQINISLHALKDKKNQKQILGYKKIFEQCEQMAEEGTYINYRIWRNDCDDLINELEKRYNTIISKTEKTKTLASNIFYSKEEEFSWPSEIKKKEEGRSSPTSRCRAIKDHIAILVDGTIVPCCLDNNAEIPLGNIFIQNLDEIMHSSQYNALLDGFSANKKVHPLCQNCTFYEQKKKINSPLSLK